MDSDALHNPPPGSRRPIAPGDGSRPRRTVAVFHLAETTGPSESLIPDLAWLADGGEVEVVVPGQGRVAERCAALGTVAVLDYTTLTFPTGALGLVTTAWRFARDVHRFRAHLRARKPDLVIAVTTMLPAVLVAARLERVRALVYVGELFEKDQGQSRSRRLLAAVTRRATESLSAGVLCCSRTVARQFEGPRARTMVATLYPPIATEYEQGDAAEFRDRHALDGARPVLAVVGNLSAGRGQDLLIRALPRIREAFPDVRCIVAGEPHPRPVDEEYRRRLGELAGELGVADAVVFPGFVENVADLYAAADVVVNPARLESFGRVACEALVAGRPVVATRVGAIPEVIRDGRDGLLVDPEDPQGLAGAVVRLLEDAELTGRLVAEGRRRVLDSFGEEENVRVFAEAVREVTGA